MALAGVTDRVTVRRRRPILSGRSSAASGPRASRSSAHRYVPLLHRVAGLNVLLVIATAAVTLVVVAPRRVSSIAVEEAVVLVAAIALVVVVNVYLLRRLVGPVQALTVLARQVDLTRPGPRMPAAEPQSEAGELASTFNEMLARLAAERRESTGRVLAAQEAERLRIAQELHDQVGQELTAILLGLARISSRAPHHLRDEVQAIQDAVRNNLEDVRRIAVELRPEALDDLGLVSALAVLTERFAQQAGFEVAQRIAADLTSLPSETELVVYRVAQEALTNVARHSGAQRAELVLEQAGDRLVLTIRDHGRGVGAADAPGTGMRGMRERATLIGAELQITNRAPGRHGCEVRLEVPLGERG
jgi:two-component system, NarL family, sensor histidine kinase UhpB